MSAPAPVLETPAEQALAASIRAAGGMFYFGNYEDTSTERTFTMRSEPGTQIATIKIKEKLVIIALPDGSVVWESTPKDGSLCGSAGGSFGLVEAKLLASGSIFMGGGKKVVLLSNGQPVLSLDAPEQYWFLPFLLLTCCMGLCCLPCMKTEMYLMKGNDRVGTATFVDGANCCGRREVRSNDPAVLRASMNLLAMMFYQEWIVGGEAPAAI
mmetsp:Transcript_8426/g.9797  ORF Transcript_8426/g.9797 Transcript_8426/m.9797 type:complete len:212 (-) Transcript_8426:113-748(-)|eukprot:CAMPEP_0197843606 /NCGR_PEP_ID=MMETSP1438-20131217/505_1 /TAXON_ID=1461541 /ORGANISM="Pterosperma sp., Strain CCMP1384" /LENGTH=211 /DNA_ID=CAMNT_0043453863 /DNA_START=125 /DNA_END=760 /DNA_ORIENTATION=+